MSKKINVSFSNTWKIKGKKKGELPLRETVNDQLKNISQIEHSRHRSVWNFLVNMLSGIAAYIPNQNEDLPNIDFMT